MKRVILILILSIGLSVMAFSVIRTGIADNESAPILGGGSIGLIALLVAIKWITADKAEKGLLLLIYNLLPGIVSWGSSNLNRTVIIAVTVGVLSAFFVIIGPLSIHQIHILTGKAKYVEINGYIQPTKQNEFISKDIWDPFYNRQNEYSNVKCLTAEQRFWKPTRNGKFLDCGEQTSPSLIVNGIDYSNLDAESTTGRRTRNGIERLRIHLHSELPERDVNDAILVATWNIRDFDSNRFGHGPRLKESYYYISEIISHFDIVAIQEVQKEIEPLKRILNILGPNYDLVYSLISPGRRGNRERMAFLYDKRKVKLGSLVASIVTSSEQLARVPYVVSFSTDLIDFTACSVHIYYGSPKGDKWQERLNEIERLSDYLVYAKQIEPDWTGPLILMGDFSSPSSESEEIQILRDNGFYLDSELSMLPSNYSKTKPYDQVAFLGLSDTLGIGFVGVFDFFVDVYSEEQQRNYKPEMGKEYLFNERTKEIRDQASRGKYYERWKTFQMSDHLPKWFEVRIVD